MIPASSPAKTRFKMALDMPWVAAYEVHRMLAQPYIRARFWLHGIRWGRDWRIWGMPIIQRFRGSQILLGDGLLLRSWRSTNPLIPMHPVVLATRSSRAVIKVGRDTGMTGATIVAAERIDIGDRVFIGANCVIVDTDFHPIDPVIRHGDVTGGAHRPVVIEDDVFIGMRSIILKGVCVGAGSVIGAGSVVSRDVAPGAVVAGNPAAFVGWMDKRVAE